MKKGRLILGMVLGTLLCSGCGLSGNNMSSSNNQLTVSEEIALEISENVVPVEAMEYSFLQYQIPYGFIAANDNNDHQATFVSEAEGDLSYICYIRQNREDGVNYMTMDTETFRSALSYNCGTDVTVDECTQEDLEEWDQVRVVYHYIVDGVSRKVWQYFFITDKYVFNMVYVQVGDANWESEYQTSAQSIVLQSIVGIEQN